MKAATGRSIRTRWASRVESSLREHLPHHPYVYFGVSGTELLYEVFRNLPRSTVVLPAFICANISAAAAIAGKRIIHIDADRQTLLPDAMQMETYLAGLDESDTILLIDHSFGYPFTRLPQLRRKFSKLMIIEDCARALGIQLGTRWPGEFSDLVLFSMYKTICGSRNGAALLSRLPLLVEEGKMTRPRLRERVANIRPLRYAYALIVRSTCSEFRSRTSAMEASLPQWTAEIGLPNELCSARFLDELTEIETRALMRREIAEELTGSLTGIEVECIKAAEGHQSSGNFVSIKLKRPHVRDELLTRLCRKGLPVARTWDLVPANYRSFQGTFPFGSANSEYLAEQMIHVRVALYSSVKRRQKLVTEVLDFMQDVTPLREEASVASLL